MAQAVHSAEKVDIISIELNSDRFNKPLLLLGTEKAAASIVAEINIFESINTPYLTGNMVLIDDHDIYRLADVQGTERIKIEFALPTKESQVIELNFVLLDVEGQMKNNDTTSTLIVNMIEDIGYYNELQQISKSYQGKGENILSNILKDNLNRNLINRSLTNSHQKPFRYIAPFISPLDAAKKVLSNMTTDTGMPYFLYSSIFSKDYNLVDLETILSKKTEAFNKGSPFKFSQITSSTSDIETQATSITAMSNSNLENTLKLAKRGAVGSDYNHINLTSGKIYPTHLNVDQQIRSLISNEIIDANFKSVLIDNKFVADPEGIDERSISDFNTKNKISLGIHTYPNSEYNAFKQPEFDMFTTLLETRKSILNMLMKNIYEIYVPGLLFSAKNSKTSVGNKIEVEILTNDDQGKVDDKRSGDFMILTKRHIFNVPDSLHNVSMGISRLTNRKASR